jgi:hypothetical protein
MYCYKEIFKKISFGKKKVADFSRYFAEPVKKIA